MVITKGQTTEKKDVGEGMLITIGKITNWISTHELSKRKSNESGQGILSLLKKKRKINGTSNISSKKKRNDEILSDNNKNRNMNYVYVKQDKLLSKRKRNDDVEEEDNSSKRRRKRNDAAKASINRICGTVNLSHLFGEDKLSRNNNVRKCKDDEEAENNDLLCTKYRKYLITCNHENTNKLIIVTIGVGKRQ